MNRDPTVKAQSRAYPRDGRIARLQSQLVRPLASRRAILPHRGVSRCRADHGSLAERQATDYVSRFGRRSDAIVGAARPAAANGGSPATTRWRLAASRPCRNAGCPRELSFAGFDDSVGARFSRPQLTTKRQPLVEMTSEAVRLLIDPAAYRRGPVEKEETCARRCTDRPAPTRNALLHSRASRR